MIVFGRFIRDRRRGLVGWSLGVVVAVASTLALFPTVKGQTSYNDLIDNLPRALRESMGLSAAVPFTSGPGYLQSRLFSTFLPILLLVFAIAAGARALGGAEEDGGLELVLANPVSRRHVLAGRYLGVVALVATLGAVALVALVVVGAPVGALDGVDRAGLLAAAVAVVGLALLHGTIAFVAGAVSGRRGPAVVAGAGVAVGGYLVQVLAASSPSLHAVGLLSPWQWLLARNMLATGPAWTALVLPVVVSAVLVVAGSTVFEQRDLR
ncbi:MAG: ABC transporter permease subunit [Acidobacteria bacterium]|nr:ABC transporter permease subunit [Acidobacteriota bacterium]